MLNAKIHMYVSTYFCIYTARRDLLIYTHNVGEHAVPDGELVYNRHIPTSCGIKILCLSSFIFTKC